MPTKYISDLAWSSLLLMRTYRYWYCNSFSNATAKNASSISPRSLLFPNVIWLPWQRPLTNRKTRFRSIICTQSAFIMVKRLRKSVQYILRNSTKYPSFAGSYQKFTNEICQLLDQSSRNFYAIYRHHLRCWGSDIPFHFRMPERQMRGVCHLSTKLVTMATSLKISEKEVQIDDLHPKRFHSVKSLRKFVH